MTNRSQYMREIYIGGLQGQPPTFTVSTSSALESLARAKLPPTAFAYVAGSSSSESTPSNNRKALDSWQIVPRMLGGVELAEFDGTVQMLGGKKYASPIIVSPIGVQSQLNSQDADLATARAAAELEVPFCLSSAGDRTIEQVGEGVEWSQEGDGEEAGAEKWFQLYWPSDDKLTESLVERAKKAGYKVLVVTLDTWILGWRPRDLDQAYNPFLQGQGLAHILSDPYFISTYCPDGKLPSKETDRDSFLQVCATAVSLLNPGISRSWEELSILRELWGDGPILLKGIQSPADAQRGLEMGMDGIVVSNHGGRQVDGAVGALQALPTIAAMCRQRGKTCIFDSGVRTGADVFKALALGAHAVGIGRPWAWGLALEGQEGVSKVLKSILADFELCAALAGCKSASEIGRHMLVKAGENL